MDPESTDANASALIVPVKIAMGILFDIILQCLAKGTEIESGLKIYFKAYGSKARYLARLIALDSSRCFFADTAVIRLGTILPRSEM